MNKDPFKEYLKESEPDKVRKGYAWSTAIGLQAVDGLTPSKYLIDTAIQNIEGKITLKEAQELIDTYYKERPEQSSDERTEEADKVSARIADENNELHNRSLHISGLLDAEKVDIGTDKSRHSQQKVDIESVLQAKTTHFGAKTLAHIRSMLDKFGYDEIFGRSAICELLELQNSSASKLLSKLLTAGIIEPVSGSGKGKYKFTKT